MKSNIINVDFRPSPIDLAKNGHTKAFIEAIGTKASNHSLRRLVEDLDYKYCIAKECGLDEIANGYLYASNLIHSQL